MSRARRCHVVTVVFVAALGACTVPAAPPDTRPPEPPLAGLAAPTPACGSDAGIADPCAYWVQCSTGQPFDANVAYEQWLLTYSGGECIDGACVFRDLPVATFCETSCVTNGAVGRCLRQGPTAP